MFDICTYDLSKLFWQRLIRLHAWDLDFVGKLLRAGRECETHRPGMANQTGSIPLSTALYLTLLAKHMGARNVVEVGTFIGKSTMALAAGMQTGTISTCDATNDAPAFGEMPVKINFNPKTTSTAMLRNLLKTPGHEADLFFFDGRLPPEDAELVKALSGPRTVYAFDDYEGIEKGVSNAAMLRHKGLAVIYPPEQELLHPYGVADRSTLGLLVPVHLFQFTAQ